MKNLSFIRAFTFLIFFLISPSALPQSTNDIALVLKVKGEAHVKKTNPGEWEPLAKGVHLDSGDMIKTGPDALLSIIFTDDKSLMKIRANSRVVIKGQRQERTISKRALAQVGELWVKVSKKGTDFRVETPSGVAAVRGTEFYGIVDEAGNAMFIGIEGIISLLNKLGSALVEAGFTGFLSLTEPPRVEKTDPDQLPDWAQENGQENELEFEFQDRDGNKKRLKIKYQTR